MCETEVLAADNVKRFASEDDTVRRRSRFYGDRSVFVYLRDKLQKKQVLVKTDTGLIPFCEWSQH